MRISLLFLVIFAACAPELHKSEVNASLVENARESMLESEPECKCQYSSPIEVKLTFSKKVISGERYEVDFIVEEPDGNKFEYGARLTKSCADDFEKRRIVTATLEKRTSGTCSPVSIQPKDYSFECWN